MPLLVVENESFLEVRDCYLRSMKKENPKSLMDNIAAINNLVPYELEEIGFWVNGDFLHDNQLESEAMQSKINNLALLNIKSCIFYNFYD